MRLHVLRTGSLFNVHDPRSSDFCEPGLFAYVMQSISSSTWRVITSWGHLGADAEVLKDVQLIADQTGKNMGIHRIHGVIDLATMITYKNKYITWRYLPKSIKHYVVK